MIPYRASGLLLSGELSRRETYRDLPQFNLNKFRAVRNPTHASAIIFHTEARPYGGFLFQGSTISQTLSGKHAPATTLENPGPAPGFLLLHPRRPVKLWHRRFELPRSEASADSTSRPSSHDWLIAHPISAEHGQVAGRPSFAAWTPARKAIARSRSLAKVSSRISCMTGA
jgi:hypothetical protein